MRPNVHKNPCLFRKHLGKHNRRVWCILNWQEKGHDNIEERRRQGDGKSLSPPAKGRLFPLLARYKKGNKGWKRYGGVAGHPPK